MRNKTRGANEASINFKNTNNLKLKYTKHKDTASPKQVPRKPTQPNSVTEILQDEHDPVCVCVCQIEENENTNVLSLSLTESELSQKCHELWTFSLLVVAWGVFQNIIKIILEHISFWLHWNQEFLRCKFKMFINNLTIKIHPSISPDNGSETLYKYQTLGMFKTCI